MVRKRKGRMERSKMKKIYTDSNFWIYCLEGTPEHRHIISMFLKSCLNKGVALYTSLLTLAECLVLPAKQDDQKLKFDYIELFTGLKFLDLIPLETMTSMKTSTLKAKYQIPTPDCIHLATALVMECNYFITNDKNLQKVKEIKTVTVEELKSLEL